jgi:hypothetical protein
MLIMLDMRGGIMAEKMTMANLQAWQRQTAQAIQGMQEEYAGDYCRIYPLASATQCLKDEIADGYQLTDYDRDEINRIISVLKDFTHGQ